MKSSNIDALPIQHKYIEALDGNAVYCITTNGSVGADRCCVMGKGTALVAKELHPKLPEFLGTRISKHGNRVYWFSKYRLFTFPTKHLWWGDSDIRLIAQSARQLVKLIEKYDIDGYVYLPKPGCCNGGLQWVDVEKVITPILSGTNVVIISI